MSEPSSPDEPKGRNIDLHKRHLSSQRWLQDNTHEGLVTNEPSDAEYRRLWNIGAKNFVNVPQIPEPSSIKPEPSDHQPYSNISPENRITEPLNHAKPTVDTLEQIVTSVMGLGKATKQATLAKQEAIAAIKAWNAAQLREYDDIFKWLLGESGDFPESVPGKRYGFRTELRERLARMETYLEKGEL